jgi:hypothetical protein
MTLSPLASKRWLALGLAVLVLLLHYRWILEGGLIGAPQSDMIRGLWGVDVQARSFALWTDHIGFPEGVKLLVLPWFSSLVVAPLVWIFGTPFVWNFWVLGLCWASGYCAALLARELTGRARSGWIVGMMMISQPMIFLALTDGTPENVAFWALPLFLMLLYRAQRQWTWGWAAGLAATVVAMDSPYHAIFALLLAPLTFVGEPAPRNVRFRGLLLTSFTSALGAGLVALLYYGLPVFSAPDSNPGSNAVHLQNWVQWEKGTLREPWDWTFSPSFIPITTLIAATVLSLLHARRALPWVAAGLLCLVLSLGPDIANANVLSDLFGPPGQYIGSTIASFHNEYPMPVVRFLRRWLVPAALSFALAAELGIAAFPRFLSFGPLVGLGMVAISVWQTSYPFYLPLSHPVRPEATTFIANHDADGAVLILPMTRAALRLHQRDELPVFASLGEGLSSASELWLQVGFRRSMVYSPTGLITMQVRSKRPEDLRTFIRDLDDLTLPQTIGAEPPPSATSGFEIKRATARKMVESGVNFLLIDEEAFGTAGLETLRKSFVELIKEEQHFADGTGITVIVLGE